MRVATIAMGLGLGAFLMTGCGDTNPLPEATGTLDENQSLRMATAIFETALMPSGLVGHMRLGVGKFGNALSDSGADNDPLSAGVHDCNNGGTYTIKITSGQSPYSYKGSEKTTAASKFVFEKKSDKCDYGNGVKQTGTIKATWDWKGTKDKSYSNDWSFTKENYVYEKDATHKVTVKSANVNGKEHKEFNNDKTTKEKYEAHISIASAEVVDGKDKVSLQSLSHDKTWESDSVKKTFTKIRKMSGAFDGTSNGKKTGGWIVYTTPEAFVRNEKDNVATDENPWYCYHAGKLEIKGKAHTITKEIKSDHSITIKFDDKVVKKYENCMNQHLSLIHI